MNATSAEPECFLEGCDYASPVVRLLGLGYYDGATEGLVSVRYGSVYRFDMIADRHGSNDLRRFELCRMPASALARAIAAIEPYHPPAWPHWTPVWTFPSPDVQRDVEAEVDRALEGGVAEWVVDCECITGAIRAAHRTLPTAASANPLSKYRCLMRERDELAAAGRTSGSEVESLLAQLDEAWYGMTVPERGLAKGPIRVEGLPSASTNVPSAAAAADELTGT